MRAQSSEGAPRTWRAECNMQRWCGARTVQTRPLFHARPTRRPAIRTRHNRARSTTISADIAAGTTLVGIDLGTSNSAISVNDDGKSIILLDDQGCAVTPSVVSYTEVCAVHCCVHHNDMSSTMPARECRDMSSTMPARECRDTMYISLHNVMWSIHNVM